VPSLLGRRSSLKAQSQSPLAIARQNLGAAFGWMIREEGNWTCLTCGTEIDVKQRGEPNISMAFYIHAVHLQTARNLQIHQIRSV
jgi:hypothetical protein